MRQRPRQFHAGVEVQDLGEAHGRHALLFERLPQRDLIPFRLRLDAKFVAFERNAGANRVMQLPLIIV